MNDDTSSNEADARSELIHYVIQQLALSDKASVKSPNLLPSAVRPDILIDTSNGIYIVEVKRKSAGLDEISRLLLYKEYYSRTQNRRVIGLVLVCPKLSPTVAEITKILDISVISPPIQLLTELERYDFIKTGKISTQSAAQRLTTPKAWSVVVTLLTLHAASILELSRKSGVSYGLTYKTIGALERRQIVKRSRFIVALSNEEKLLDGIAWERPLESLKILSIQTEYNDWYEAASQISETLSKMHITFAFTARTAGSLYTKYGSHFNIMDMYLPDPDTYRFVPRGNGSVTVNVFGDKHALRETQTIDSIVVVGKAQALLDLIGLGLSTRDLTLSMLRNYVSIH